MIKVGLPSFSVKYATQNLNNDFEERLHTQTGQFRPCIRILKNNVANIVLYSYKGNGSLKRGSCLESNFYAFLGLVVMISLSGVLMPGPLFAATIQKAAKSKVAGVLLAFGHGVVEFPLMILIYFVLNQFAIPNYVQPVIGVVGGGFMVFMGVRAFKNRNCREMSTVGLKWDSFFAGVWTSAANAGFILWWLTVGTVLIVNAQFFGLFGFGVFAGLHWFIDFLWYALVGLFIFKSQKFWTSRVHYGVTLFCVGVFVLFGVYFVGSALISIFAV
jgi:threonine/homoserine/homoserine lactone efflux protein